MLKTSEAIYNILIADSELTDQLGTNVPFYNPKGEASKLNSIVPADLVTRGMVRPIITIDEGSELKIGTHQIAESVYVRCYNVKSKSNIDINLILDRIKLLLDGSTLELDDRRFISISWEFTSPSLIEESLDSKFKEARYRILVI